MGKRVIISQLQPGMILDEPVKESFGRILLPAGSEIDEKSMRLMKMWGVIDVLIKDSGDKEEGLSPLDPVSPKQQEEAKEAMAILFKHTDRTTPLMEEFYRLAVHYHLKVHVKDK